VAVLADPENEDGHTASLFPGSPALAESSRRVVAVSGAPKPPPERITITPVAIDAARRIIVIASGAAKAEPVQRATQGPWNPQETPAQLARRGVWILDQAAARLTPRSSA
jgi:6-phosphogluconolactonase